MSDERAVEYLVEVLALDATQAAGRIVELREQFRSGAALRRSATKSRRGARSKKKTPAKAREAMVRVFDDVRAKFYELDAAETRRRLGALDLVDAPDLERARQRLLEIDAERDAIADLLADDKVDRALAESLRRILVATAPEAAELREAAVNTVRGWRAVWRAKAFARKVRKSYPKLAELEDDWLSQLASVSRDRRDSVVAPKRHLALVHLFVGMFVLSFIAKLVAWLMRSFGAD